MCEFTDKQLKAVDRITEFKGLVFKSMTIVELKLALRNTINGIHVYCPFSYEFASCDETCGELFPEIDDGSYPCYSLCDEIIIERLREYFKINKITFSTKGGGNVKTANTAKRG